MLHIYFLTRWKYQTWPPPYMALRGWSGALKYSPMLPKGVSLVDSRCKSFKSKWRKKRYCAQLYGYNIKCFSYYCTLKSIFYRKQLVQTGHYYFRKLTHLLIYYALYHLSISASGVPFPLPSKVADYDFCLFNYDLRIRRMFWNKKKIDYLEFIFYPSFEIF